MAVLLIGFQNCGDWRTRGGSAPSGQSSQSPPGDPGFAAREAPQFAAAEDLEIWRERIWAGKCGPDSDWEVCFEGAHIPGYDQPAPFDWDNPRDDDWNRADSRALSWITGLSDIYSLGFMRVDRIVTGFQLFSGHFWRRDEFLTAEHGFEAAFRVRILPHSHRYGVMLHFKDNVHQFKLHFAPDQITFHPLIGMASAAAATQARRNTSFSAFVVRKQPATGLVEVWADGTKMFTGQTLAPGAAGNLWEPVTGRLGWIAPQIGFGDNNNDFDNESAGAYDVDYFYYRRASVPPGRAGLRSPQPLPRPDLCADWRELRNNTGGIPVLEVINLGSSIDDVSPGKFARSFEVRTRLLDNGKQSNGFSFDYVDRLGGINITIFPDRITAKGAGKPGLPTAARIPGFNGLAENRIRFARGDDGLYWHVFLNDNPVPVLVDVRSSGFSTPNREFLAGPFITKAISDLAASENVASREPTGAAADVPLIRWCP